MTCASAGQKDEATQPASTISLTPDEKKQGLTAFHKAAQEGNVEALKALLADGADKLAVTKKKWNALHFAAAGGHVDAINFLLGAGLMLEQKTSAMGGGWATPLFLAAKQGHVKAVAALLARGANPNATAMESWTPLHIAAAKGHTAVVTELLKHGAKANALTDRGETALQWAAANGNTAIVKDLVQIGKADLRVLNMEGKTPLHLAAEGAHLETVKYLLSAGAPVNALDKKGETALDLCDPRFVKKWRGVKNPARHKQVFDYLRAHKAKRGWELRAKSKPGRKKKRRR